MAESSKRANSFIEGLLLCKKYCMQNRVIFLRPFSPPQAPERYSNPRI